MDLGDNLLGLAQKVAKRVVVKRPRLAVFLANQETTHQWLGDACRFDAYFQHERLD
jgi:16S rRNA (guanine1516-N2)-methyltransferase